MNKEKIREVAFHVWLDMREEYGDIDSRTRAEEFLNRCLQELSKDVEPVIRVRVGKINDSDCTGVALVAFDDHREWSWMDLPEGESDLYLHPPLTEQDKRDAGYWIAIRQHGHVPDEQLGRYVKCLIEQEAIDKATENGK